eukprot:scaffold388815_cov33-Prasinocladus_malaysianus.AAC.1
MCQYVSEWVSHCTPPAIDDIWHADVARVHSFTYCLLGGPTTSQIPCTAHPASTLPPAHLAARALTVCLVAMLQMYVDTEPAENFCSSECSAAHTALMLRVLHTSATPRPTVLNPKPQSTDDPGCSNEEVAETPRSGTVKKNEIMAPMIVEKTADEVCYQ